MTVSPQPLQMPAGLSSFFSLVWLLPTFLALPACLVFLFVHKGHRKPAFVVSTGIAYLLTGIAHLFLLFDQASVFRGRWNYLDPQGFSGIPYKRDLCTAQVSLTAGVGFLVGFHLIGLVRDLLLETQDILQGQAQHLRRRKGLTICGIVFAWIIFGLVAGFSSWNAWLVWESYKPLDDAFGADGKLPYCSIPSWILVVCTEVPLAFASCIVLVFVVRNYLRIRVLPAARATLSERAFICRLGFTAVLTIILILHAISMGLNYDHLETPNKFGAGPTLLLALSATGFAGIYAFQPRLKTGLMTNSELMGSLRPMNV